MSGCDKSFDATRPKRVSCLTSSSSISRVVCCLPVRVSHTTLPLSQRLWARSIARSCGARSAFLQSTVYLQLAIRGPLPTTMLDPPLVAETCANLVIGGLHFGRPFLRGRSRLKKVCWRQWPQSTATVRMPIWIMSNHLYRQRIGSRLVSRRPARYQDRSPPTAYGSTTWSSIANRLPTQALTPCPAPQTDTTGL